MRLKILLAAAVLLILPGYAGAESLSSRLDQIYAQQNAENREFQIKYNMGKSILLAEMQKFNEIYNALDATSDHPAVQAMIAQNPAHKTEIKKIWHDFSIQVLDQTEEFLAPHCATAYAQIFSADFLNQLLTALNSPLEKKSQTLLLSFLQKNSSQYLNELHLGFSQAFKQAEGGANLRDALLADPALIKFQKDYDVYLESQLTPEDRLEMQKMAEMQKTLEAKKPEFVQKVTASMQKESKYNFASFGIEIARMALEMRNKLARLGISLPSSNDY